MTKKLNKLINLLKKRQKNFFERKNISKLQAYSFQSLSKHRKLSPFRTFIVCSLFNNN